MSQVIVAGKAFQSPSVQLEKEYHDSAVAVTSTVSIVNTLPFSLSAVQYSTIKELSSTIHIVASLDAIVTV
jgi:50S ribosomal subunit-associated GTPase HflX